MPKQISLQRARRDVELTRLRNNTALAHTIHSMNRGVFITGTDTGIGKTTVSCALLHALREIGVDAVGMKPVASGCESTTAGWRNDDALRLIAASAPRGDAIDYAMVNPYALPAPTAPELAASDVGVAIELPVLQTAFAGLSAASGFVLVEGVGGWAAPISATLDQAELVRALGLPVILVVGLRLGCINHSRLSAQAIHADGLRLLGWIGNAVDPDFERCAETVAILDRCIPAPRLGRLPHAPDMAAAGGAAALSAAAAVLADFRQGAAQLA